MTTTKIILRKLEETIHGNPQWVVVGRPDLLVVRREWVLPYASRSYVLTRDGKVLDEDLQTLADVRDYILEWESES